MAEYVASRGTTALGIIGTALGGLATAGGLAGLGINPTTATTTTSFENTSACMHDLDTIKELAQKDAEIARLNSERYSDAALATAKEFATNGMIDIYKELKSDINTMKETSTTKWGEQGIINANLNTGISALSGQVNDVATTVANITKTAVPTSAICNFSGGCTSCGGTI